MSHLDLSKVIRESSSSSLYGKRFINCTPTQNDNVTSNSQSDVQLSPRRQPVFIEKRAVDTPPTSSSSCTSVREAFIPRDISLQYVNTIMSSDHAIIGENQELGVRDPRKTHKHEIALLQGYRVMLATCNTSGAGKFAECMVTFNPLTCVLEWESADPANIDAQMKKSGCITRYRDEVIATSTDKTLVTPTPHSVKYQMKGTALVLSVDTAAQLSVWGDGVQHAIDRRVAEMGESYVNDRLALYSVMFSMIRHRPRYLIRLFEHLDQSSTSTTNESLVLVLLKVMFAPLFADVSVIDVDKSRTSLSSTSHLLETPGHVAFFSLVASLLFSSLARLSAESTGSSAEKSGKTDASTPKPGDVKATGGISVSSELRSYMRRDSCFTRLLRIYTHHPQGTIYLKTLLSDTISEAVRLSKNPNVLHEVVQESDGTTPVPTHGASSPEVMAMVEKLISKLIQTENTIPAGIRFICQAMHNAVSTSLPTATPQDICSMVGSFFFLRYVNPSIVAPHLSGVADQEPSLETKRVLTSVAKLLQELTSASTFSEARPSHLPAEFLNKNSRSLRDFLQEIGDPEDPSSTVDLSTFLKQPIMSDRLVTNASSAFDIHKSLRLYIDVLCPLPVHDIIDPKTKKKTVIPVVQPYDPEIEPSRSFVELMESANESCLDNNKSPLPRNQADESNIDDDDRMLRNVLQLLGTAPPPSPVLSDVAIYIPISPIAGQARSLIGQMSSALTKKP